MAGTAWKRAPCAMRVMRMWRLLERVVIELAAWMEMGFR